MDLPAKMNLNNAVERVLHVPGNYGGGILEMTLVIDCQLPKEYVKQMSFDISSALRAHSEVFRNVRLNLLYWKSDEDMENQVVPLPFLQMGSSFEGYEERTEEKSLDALSANLKLFHARSKLILVLTGENLLVRDKEALRRNMYPFLGKKSLFLRKGEPDMKWKRGQEL
ncbi:MAG: hypothetical protein NC400_04075 [Clostridium sp.]|nr:hypothetical protein [Clostridium sp.]